MVGGRGARLARESVVQGDQLFLALDAGAGGRGERARSLVRAASRVDPAWLDGHPALQTSAALRWDPERERVVAERTRVWMDLVLDATPVPLTDRVAAAAVLAREAAADLDRALGTLDAKALTLLRRTSLVARLRPELGLPADRQRWLTDTLPALCAGRSAFADLRKVDLAGALRDSLPWPQRQAIDRLAPVELTVPSGSRIRLDYPEHGPPVLAVRVQEVFGLRDTPAVVDGRQPVLMHLLSPARRPLQVTSDLENFWAQTWPEVRKEMRSRYPKHRWPEDPGSAEPSRHTTQRPPRRRGPR